MFGFRKPVWKELPDKDKAFLHGHVEMYRDLAERIRSKGYGTCSNIGDERGIPRGIRDVKTPSQYRDIALGIGIMKYKAPEEAVEGKYHAANLEFGYDPGPEAAAFEDCDKVWRLRVFHSDNLEELSRLGAELAELHRAKIEALLDTSALIIQLSPR